MKKWLLILASFSLISCSQKISLKHNCKTLHIGIKDDPCTLDPRKSIDVPTINVINMLFEGLMRFNENEELTLALAQSVEISKDNTEYTFHLKEANWSDGTLISAYDFERSWKEILSPSFPAGYVHKFFMIKNAKEANEGKVSLEEVGINAQDEKTLKVALNYPTPYFLELTAQCIFFPLPKNNSFLEKEYDKLPCSGPFKVKKWDHHSQLVLIKNQEYWDQRSIQIEKIHINIIDNENTLLTLFESKELDWVGKPFSEIPMDARDSLYLRNLLNSKSITSTLFIDFNTEKPPFSNIYIRKAFSMTIDRKSIVDHIANSIPQATERLIPDFVKSPSDPFIQNLNQAQHFLNKGLKELGLNKNDLSIHFLYDDFEYSHKLAQALHQQWKIGLGIDVILEKKQWKTYLEDLSSHNYQIAKLNWTADLLDPIAFLNLFRLRFPYSENPRWPNPSFLHLLELADRSLDRDERYKLLKEAEDHIIDNSVIAPIHFGFSQYVKNPKLKNVLFTKTGNVDFRWAYFE